MTREKFMNWLISPFTFKPFLFIYLTLLIAFIEISNSICSLNISFLIQITFFDSLIAYIITLIYNIIPHKLLKNTYLYSTVAVIILMHIINYITNSILNMNFSAEIATIIAETNRYEIKEFICNFIDLSHILFVFIIILTTVISIFLIKKYDKTHLSRKLAYISLVIPFFGIGAYINHPAFRYYTFIGTLSACRYIFHETPNIVLTLNKSDVNILGNQPQNIVLIIGESYVKSHSSLYGYKYNTTPMMKRLLDNNEILIYDSVVSPATNTNEVFTHIMSKSDTNSALKWYESVSIPELANTVCYDTYWISNQNEKGLYDNISSRFASLCKNKYFSDNTYKAWDKKNYDEIILPYVSQVSDKSIDKKFIIIHLMGQHFDFKTRHPETFNYFKPNQYYHLPEYQRAVVASYDNATLYNDYVVSNIISKFKDQEAIIIYTSDHSLDLYSSSEYYGYARANNAKSYQAATEIPFIIYASEKYKNTHADKYEDLKKRKNKPFNTGNLIFFIMDIMNVDLK